MSQYHREQGVHAFPRPAARLRVLPLTDKSYFIGRSPAATTYLGSTGVLISARKGQVQLITKLVNWTQGARVTSPSAAPISDTVNMLLIDGGGTTRETLSIHCPVKVPNLFAGAQQANNDRPIIWEPSMPIIVPEGWRVDVTSDSTQGASIQAFGLKMDPAEARGLGLNVEETAGAQSVRTWIQTGAIMAGSGATVRLVPVRAGYGFEITDILCRFQAISGTNGAVDLRKSDGTVIFHWVQSQVTGEPVDKIIKTSIFIDPADGGSPITTGYGLDLVPSGTNVLGTIIILGRYIKADRMPNDAWWAFATGGFATATFTPMQLRTMKAPPGKARALIMQGCDWSIGRDTTAPGGGSFFSLAAAASAASLATGTISETSNINLRNIVGPFLIESQSQQTNFTIDDVEMPLPENWGLFQLSQVDPLATPPADGDTVDMGVTVWGRTDWTVTRGPGENSQYTGG